MKWGLERIRVELERIRAGLERIRSELELNFSWDWKG